MSVYNAPLNDMRFILTDVFKAHELWQNNDKLSHVDMETVDMILEEMAKLSKNVLLPINRSGDEEGATFQGDGVVTTPQGFKEAYKQYAESGWVGLGGNPEYGGQGFPKMVTMLTEEMMFTSNQSFALYPNLTVGATMCMNAAASDEIKEIYLEKMYAGEWSGTMCLTEPHAGTDLGIIKTKAEPNDDGSFNISGTKIFITGGEHDLTDNIIHLVLAKTPNAPSGSKGISLFVVPKFLVKEDGSLGARNTLAVGSIEHKMGIKASATCVMNFDGAKGWMIGAENTGLSSMFIMMNYERVTMGLQGLGGTELAYQNAALYALDRAQGRSDTQLQSPEKPADAIIHHADVRRMLLNAKANSEASRCFAMYVAQQLDIEKFSSDPEVAKTAAARVALLTPIAKAFLTDKALEATIDCQQVFGGHGYVREWGMEQIVRDTRIAQIYEGANGIQALDLLGRKVARNEGKYIANFLGEIRDYVAAMTSDHGIKQATLAAADTVEELTSTVLTNIGTRKNEINGCAVDYMHAVGYLCYSYMFAMMVEAADGKQGKFYSDKAKLADYFVGRILPRIDAHAQMVKAGSDPMMNFDLEYFNVTAS
ncbi:acyl-CoA dehydrogenase C-terminal domain-containing protein [Psychrobacter sp. TAE2020]|uniref:acyl-CoA dehydrogenase C-terminal domain-containing protein n=1 Tax=Psychrobacter sp. TAE2020 TaxID=2846762 RepID=UPI001C0FB839|nr:acyl-CoA dehydrogenase C-terminal domain-containing protein [Psychrobacter sp. TAE2020]MBU5615593.1 acyl-CoA dehydrogenase C-terminal domain-containing protein [Psychrobacter sp. TAE2020]